LVIVSHVTHYAWEGRLYAYSPYAREIDVWADLFPEVVIAAPCRAQAPPTDACAFSRDHITVDPQIEAGGDHWSAKLRQLLLLPVMTWSLARAIRRGDAVHVRCPGNLGLLGALLAPLLCRYRVAKYAGQWPDHPGVAFASRLQKRLLQSAWWNAPVTVYGQWDHQPAHIVPFFTSIMTRGQVARARRAAASRPFDEPALRVLFVGMLAPWKNPDAVIRGVAALRAQGIAVECDMVGSGASRADLEQLASTLGVADVVRFAGAVGPEQVHDYYERCHVLVLPSNSEGWPKVVAEAMAFGLICVGSDRGLIPQMLGEGRGFVVPPHDAAALAGVLQTIGRSADRFPEMRARAAEWGQRYSLEDLRDAIADLLSRAWGVPVSVVPAMHAQAQVAPHA
jgi:glycosyltransferase involved in cell wall biosynthesis